MPLLAEKLTSLANAPAEESEFEIDLEDHELVFKDLPKKQEVVKIDSDDDIEITSAHLASDIDDGKKSTEMFK